MTPEQIEAINKQLSVEGAEALDALLTNAIILGADGDRATAIAETEGAFFGVDFDPNQLRLLALTQIARRLRSR